MRHSLSAIAEQLLSVGDIPLDYIAMETPLRATNSVVTPQDPTTLALAAAGIATIVVFVAAGGWRPRRNNPPRERIVEFDGNARPRKSKRGDDQKRGAA